jgi:hypothetical protein
MVRLDFAIPYLSGGCDAPEQPQKEKADVVDHPQGFDHIGLLVNEPPGQAGLPLVLSSDDFQPGFIGAAY